MTFRILLADDHALVREGLAGLLRREPDLEVVADVSDGELAWAGIEKLRPDVAVLDITMPGFTGIELTRKIRAAGFATAVVLLSMHREPSFVRDAVAAGASGYVLKNAASRELIEAVRATAARGIYFSPAIAQSALEALRQADTKPELTPRERDVLRLLAQGNSSKEIAAALAISVRTVDWNRTAIMDKLGIRNIPGLVKYAILNHLTTLE